jgi:ABC-type multidrug transport system permease subunit
MAMQDDVIVAYELNDQTLSQGLRLIIPEANGDLWINMITSISMSTTLIETGTSILTGGLRKGPQQTSTNTTEPTSTPQPQVTPQPTPTSTKSAAEPTVTPTNVTSAVSPTNATVPQSEQKVSSFPVETAYFAARGLVVAVVAASFVVYRYKTSGLTFHKF